MKVAGFVLVACLFLKWQGFSEPDPSDAVIKVLVSNLEMQRKSVLLVQSAETWPDSFIPMKMKLEKPIKDLEAHQKFLRSIPHFFIEGYHYGETREEGDWILTSLDPDNSQAGESLWILAVATHKKEAAVYTAGTW